MRFLIKSATRIPLPYGCLLMLFAEPNNRRCGHLLTSGRFLPLWLAICCGAPFFTSLACHAAEAISYETFSYGENSREMLDVYGTNEPGSKSPTVIFFYGGSWHVGSKRDYAFLGKSLASKGIVAVIPDLPLFPMTQYPGFLDDAASVVAWTKGHIADYGGNSGQIFLMGYSSGVYMAIMLAMDPQFLAHVHLAPDALSGVIGIAGLYNIDTGVPEMGDVFSGVRELNTIQPEQLAIGKTPPVLFLVPGRDETGNAASAENLKNKLVSHGNSSRIIIYPDTGPIGIMLPFSPASHQQSTIVDDVVSFITHGQ